MRAADQDEARKHEQLVAEIRRCSDEQQISWGTVSGGAPGTEKILRRVGQAGDVPGEYTASVWKVLSGLSHPVRADPSVTLTSRSSVSRAMEPSRYVSPHP